MSLTKISLSTVKGDVEKFYKRNNIAMSTAMSNGKNESIDGTGQNPSVNRGESRRITDYILRKFDYEGSLKVIDVGTGMGQMVKALVNSGIDGYGIEGFAPLAEKCAAGKERVCAIDLATVELDTASSFKCANLTTSFEVFEHVHRKHEDLFIRNLAWMSDWHLCSIHMFKWPGIGANHCNIKHECCWLELFRKYNIKCEVIGHRTGKKDPIAKEYAGTTGSLPGPHLGGSEEFREETDTHHWEESMFCILDMREYKF